MALLPPLLGGVMGFLAHRLGFPVLAGWNNRRMRRFGRLAMGVLSALPVFLVCRHNLRRLRVNGAGTAVATDDATAYLLAFLWTSMGVLLGYIVGDGQKRQE